MKTVWIGLFALLAVCSQLTASEEIATAEQTRADYRAFCMRIEGESRFNAIVKSEKLRSDPYRVSALPKAIAASAGESTAFNFAIWIIAAVAALGLVVFVRAAKMPRAQRVNSHVHP